MPVPPPTPQELQEIARSFNFALTDAEADEYLEHVSATLDAYAALDDLDDGRGSSRAGRDPGAAPKPGQNPVVTAGSGAARSRALRAAR